MGVFVKFVVATVGCVGAVKHKGREPGFFPGAKSMLRTLVGTAVGAAATSVAADSASPNEYLVPLLDDPSQMETAFRDWANENDKPYVSLGGSSAFSGDEYGKRLGIFKDNVARIVDLNAKHEGKTTFNVNRFADLGADEFKQKWTGFVVPVGAAEKRKKLPNYDAKPNFLGAFPNVDYRGTAVTPIKDQGQCGSCWAFSTTSTLESAYMFGGGEQTILAPQELVSCDTEMHGCGGGSIDEVFQWMESEGMEKNSDYPYKSGDTGKNYKCKVQKSKEVLKVVEHKVIDDETEMESFLVEHGPFSVGVDATNWQLYEGGIFSDCETNLDHAVQVIGAGTEAGQKYWIVRNSWGSTWGEEGIIRVKATENTCGIADMANGVTSAQTEQSVAVAEEAQSSELI